MLHDNVQHDKKLSKRQSKLKDRLQSQMKERQKFRKTSTAALGTADNSMVQVAILAVMQKDTNETKKQFDKESLLAVVGNKDGIDDVIHQYETDGWKVHEVENDHFQDEEGKTEDVQSKEAIIALKMAQQRLETEIRHEQDLNEQLKVSSIKQVHLCMCVC